MIQKKILLISGNTFVVPYPVYPIGISYIKTYFNEKAPEYDVNLFDCNTGTYSDLIKLLKEFNPKHKLTVTSLSIRKIYERSCPLHYQPHIHHHIVIASRTAIRLSIHLHPNNRPHRTEQLYCTIYRIGDGLHGLPAPLL